MIKSKLKYLVIHCSDTPEGKWFEGKDIIKWHTSPKPLGRGWKVPGYSEVIRLDGTIETIVKYNDDIWVTKNEITNGAKGFNNVSRHICLIGGQDENGNHKDTFTKEQKETLYYYVMSFKISHPNVKVIGHCDLNKNKPYCPGFNLDYLQKL
jgi:hypothetical protein